MNLNLNRRVVARYLNAGTKFPGTWKGNPWRRRWPKDLSMAWLDIAELEGWSLDSDGVPESSPDVDAADKVMTELLSTHKDLKKALGRMRTKPPSGMGWALNEVEITEHAVGFTAEIPDGLMYADYDWDGGRVEVLLDKAVVRSDLEETVVEFDLTKGPSEVMAAAKAAQARTKKVQKAMAIVFEGTDLDIDEPGRHMGAIKAVMGDWGKWGRVLDVIERDEHMALTLEQRTALLKKLSRYKAL